MALSRVKTWNSGDVLTASDLNAEFNNVLNNPVSLISPLTGAINLNGYALTLDAAAVSTLQSTASQFLQLTPGNKSGTPGTTGGIVNVVASTYTDNNTAGAGTASQFAANAFQRPTLAASNAGVTTTDAATVYVAGGPIAGTNETLTNAWAIQAAGNVKATQYIATTQTLTDGVTVAWDASLGAVATWTIAGNRTLSAPTNLKTGARYTLHITQDGTGGRTITWNAVYLPDGGGTMPQPAGTASSLTTFVFESPDGTKMRLVGRQTSPTRQVFTTGTAATYTTPTGCTRINVRMVGGGGGGSGATANNGTAGNQSSFGTLTAAGGGGGIQGGLGGAAGGATNGDITIGGGSGEAGETVNLAGLAAPGGCGGNSAFGGGGGGGNGGIDGQNAGANSGGGGGGGGGTGNTNSGSGGGAGGYCEKLIVSPASTYTYTVGAPANGGAAGGNKGGNGAAGLIIVDEYYD